MNLYLFDVCNTLFRVNTTFDFILFVLDRKKDFSGVFLLKMLISRKSPLFYAGVLINKLTNSDMQRYIALKLLRNISKQELDQFGDWYFQERLNSLKYAKTHTMLGEALQNGDRVVLISSSIDPVIGAIAKALRIEFFSSQLDYSNGICNGKLKKDLCGKKELLFDEIVAENAYENIIVVSDNLSDKALLERADQRWVVLEKDYKKTQWVDFDARFLHVWQD